MDIKSTTMEGTITHIRLAICVGSTLKKTKKNKTKNQSKTTTKKKQQKKQNKTKQKTKQPPPFPLQKKNLQQSLSCLHTPPPSSLIKGCFSHICFHFKRMGGVSFEEKICYINSVSLGGGVEESESIPWGGVVC